MGILSNWAIPHEIRAEINTGLSIIFPGTPVYPSASPVVSSAAINWWIFNSAWSSSRAQR